MSTSQEQEPVLLQCFGCERVGTQEQLSASTDCDCWLHTRPAPVQEPVNGLIYPGGGEALFNRLWHLTCNAVATQSGMRVRTDVLPMREMKEFLDHLRVLVDSPPMQELGHDVVAGAIFDFAGFLTSHKDKIEAGSSANAGPMVERIREWAGRHGLSLDGADVVGWHKLTAQQPRKAVKLSNYDVGGLTVFDGLHHVETPLLAEFIRAIEQAVWAKNGIEQ